VKWDDLCRPKEEAGLGIRDLRLVNKSLLAKWRWKLLSHENEVWKDIVSARYGNDVVGKRFLCEVDAHRLSSSWWRDLCQLDGDDRWFGSAVGMKVGRGDSTYFWDEIWIGDQSLRAKFPRLYGMSEQKHGLIHEMGSLIDGRWQWDFVWRRNRFYWEEEQFREFTEIIAPFVPTDNSDRWLWLGDGIQGFTVKSAFLLLEGTATNRRILIPDEVFVYKKLWKCAAPSKVRAFAWQLLQDRIQTKENLYKRRMLQLDQQTCVMCNRCIESASHLFLHCDYAAKVWYALTKWLGIYLIVPPNISMSFAMWATCVSNKKGKAVMCMIWNAFIWILWKVRNDYVFKNKVTNIEEMVDRVKLVSWQWFIGRLAKSPCLLYEWEWSPIDCMRR
jgi:hypothetical protein